MSERFFQSPDIIDIPDDMPLVFLEGPVQGAPDWQTPFANSLLEAVAGIAVASPRATSAHQVAFTSKDPETKIRASEKQVAYEFIARRRTLQYGAVVLWYAAQDLSIPYNQARRYGKTTPIENGEVWGWMMAHPDYPLILGFDSAFQEGPDNSRGYISRNHELIGLQEHASLYDVFNATVSRLETIKNEVPRPIPALTSQSIQRALDQLGSK
ncbi:MAG: hypothetical protein ACOH18_04165 [Candidatus Saccharimonadaceae bacterium]